MIHQITNKIMNNGITKYAEKFNESKSKVQIRVRDENDKLKYEICANWQPKEEITFKDILDRKIDILGYEAISTPFLKKSLDFYSESLDIPLNDLSIFIFSIKNVIAIAIYDKHTYKSTIKLKEHFELIGM